MSGLTHLEKQKLERELGMAGGHVLEFTNRNFEEFFRETLHVEIYSDQFAAGSGSKAHRMRAFWRAASDEQLRLLFIALQEGWDIYANQAAIPEPARALLSQVVKRLGGHATDATLSHKVAASSIDQNVADKLSSRLIELTTFSPQERGYKFEEFLKDLFNAYDLSARASFRIIGEQIDGSFVLHNEIYLLEAKWQNAPIGVADLHVFEGKLGEKAAWSRGLFVSNSGFSVEGLQAFGRAKRIVCMNGLDLFDMLRLRLSLTDVLSAKVRRAAETGHPLAAVRDLFN